MFLVYGSFFLLGISSYVCFLRNKMKKDKDEKTIMLSFWPKGFICRLCAKQETCRCQKRDCQYLKYQKLKAVLKSSRTSVKVCIALLKYPDEIETLLLLHKRGVSVQLIVDKKLQTQAINATRDLQNLADSCAPILYVNLDGLMHHKFILIDDKTLVITSLNHSNMGFYGNYENMEISNNSTAVSAFKKEFEYIWEHGCNV